MKKNRQIGCRMVFLLAFVFLTLMPNLDAADIYGNHRIIIKPKADGIAGVENLHVALGTRSLRTYPRFGGIQVVELPAGSVVEEVRDAFENSGLVEYAEFDYIYRTSSQPSPSDPKYTDGTLWGMHNTGQPGGSADADIDAPEAWHYRYHANEVVVAVIDTGINYTHEDLAKNMWRNAAEANGTAGLDDDGNGYIDDIHGINAISGSGDPMDDDNHGSHVAGTIGAVGDNGLGLVGVAWRVQLMALKFMGNSGYSSDAIECIHYAIDNGATILNNSWGSASFDQALADVIRVAGNGGAIFVAAAGNLSTDTDASPHYPSSYESDNVISVAATDRYDARPSFSNYGRVSVDLSAPGSAILSCGKDSSSHYWFEDGTSMAAPHVTGALALLKAQFPAESYQQLINRLLSNTDAIASFFDQSQTGGRLNLHRSLTSISTAPPNDTFANSFNLVIPFTSITATGNNVDATKETNEPNHGGYSGGNSVWWQWTAPSDLPNVTIKTKGTSFNTLLAVYTGNSVSTLTPVGSSVVSDGCGFSQVSFSATYGSTYRIAVDGYNAGSGPESGIIKLTIQTSGDASTSTLRFVANSLQRTAPQFAMQLAGPASARVYIDRSEDMQSWTQGYDSFDLDSSGIHTYTDSGAGGSANFYRARTATLHSCNAVGYADLPVPASVDKMIANPFNRGNNTITDVIPNPPDATELHKFNDITDSYESYIFFSGGWSDPNVTLAPGEGAIIRSATAFTQSMVGEVSQGYQVNPVPSGYSIRASIYPRPEVISSLGFPVANGDNIQKMVNGEFRIYTFHNGIWSPAEPEIGVGESFFINKRTHWKQTLSVWP